MDTIYIIDDDLPILDALTLWFEREQYAVKTFTNSASFLSSMMKEKPSLVLMDINLVTDDGRQLCLLIKAKYKDRLPVILMSANPALGQFYTECEANAFVSKPFNLSTLRKVVSNYLS